MGPDAGAAYVFTREENGNWIATPPQQLLAEDGTAGDHFGVSVALSASGDMALVGASTGAYPPVRATDTRAGPPTTRSCGP